MSVAVILPTYNEKGNIIQLVEEIVLSVKNVTNKFSIYVIDDNSPDKTAEYCRKYFRNKKNVKVFVRTRERGFASAILYGIVKSKENIVVVMDTDFSHDPKLIPTMVSRLSKCDIVIASRYAKKGGGENKTRFWLSKIYNIYLAYLLRIKISDFLFGYFCVRRRFLVENDLLNKDIFYGFGDYFMRLAYFVNKAQGNFFEISAYYKNRSYGESKSNIYKMLITYTITSLRIFALRFKND